MASKAKNDKSLGVLSSLKTWRNQFNIGYSPLLAQLANDLENSENLKIWAEINPNEYLPNPESTKAVRRLKRINQITGIRNIFVFTPVALTWAAISIVTAAFSDYEKANPNSIINFLEFWQQGFGFINDFWRLSNVAIFDVLLVSIVILLTFTINVLSRQNFERETAEITEIAEARSALIFQLNSFFYEYKYPTANQVNKNIFAATKSLDKSLKALSKIVGRLEKDIAKYPSSAKMVVELKNINQEIKKFPKK